MFKIDKNNTSFLNKMLQVHTSWIDINLEKKNKDVDFFVKKCYLKILQEMYTHAYACSRS